MIKKLENDVRLSTTLFMAKNNDNFFKPSLIDNKEKETNNNINNKTNNRFQNLFDNEDTSILINGPKISNQNPIIEETNINFEANNKKEEKEEELRTIIIPRELDINDPNACRITFRYPYGEKHIERRFSKNDKIKVLYNYVESLGKEIYSKPIYHSFELNYGFPPINFENKKDKTLDDEGLFPSSMINIIEK